MSRQAFRKAYNEFAGYYGEKKYCNCIDVFQKIDLKSNYSDYKEQVEFLLRTACQLLRSVPKPKDTFTLSVANAFEGIFSKIAETPSYDKFFAITKIFTSFDGLDKYLAPFAQLNLPDFDFKRWLHNINNSLFQTLKNAKISSFVQKDMYLELTHVLLFFVNAETQRTICSHSAWRFGESLRFLENCTKLDLFQRGEKQYNESFELLQKFLACLQVDKEKLAQTILEFHVKFRKAVKSNNLRATLVQDSFITIIKLSKICEQRFIESINTKNCGHFFDFIGYINRCTAIQTNKQLCSYCKSTTIHLSHEITMTVMDMVERIINEDLDDKATEQIATIIRKNFEAISQLDCRRAQFIHESAVIRLVNLFRMSENKEKAKNMIPTLKTLLKHFDQFKLLEGTKYFNETALLNNLFLALKQSKQWEEMIDTGYLLMAFIRASETMTNFENIAFAVAKTQKDMNTSVKSPYDFFNQIKKELPYTITLPQNHDVLKLSMAFLKAATKYAVISKELNNKIVHQMLMTASSNDPSSLRFVLIISSLNFDKLTNERANAITKALQSISKNDHSVNLLLAAMKYYKFNYDATELSEKHKELSITQALAEDQLASSSSIFNEITFDREKGQINTLRGIKKAFIEFTNFYIGKTDADRKVYEEERDFLLRDVKMLANQFVVRGYFDDGFELYMTLYRLSNAVNDEFGVIDSCSFFAEYSADFKQKFPSENINTIIEKCFSAVVKKLKELKTLSTRKQNQVCFCMLNLVLFYYEDGGDKKKEIHMILSYIFKTVGGIGDKGMHDCLNAAVGINVASDKKDDPKIHSEAVRIKFFSVLFTIVTRYNAPCTFSPDVFVYFVLAHVRKCVGIYFDSTAAVPILLFSMIPQMAFCLHSMYEAYQNHQSLMLTLLKLAIRSGYALRAANMMLTSLHTNLLCEDLNASKPLFKALKCIMISPEFDTSNRIKSEKISNHIDEVGALSIKLEPIRKVGTVINSFNDISLSPKIEPTQTQVMKFVQNHSNDCDCGLCFSPENKFQVYCTAVAYARFLYLNEKEYDFKVVQPVFKELLSYWEANYKDKTKFPRNDLFFMASARMLIYRSHFSWKFEKDWMKARDHMKRSLKALDKIKFGASLIKMDVQRQIIEMEETIKRKHIPKEERFQNIWILNRKKSFGDEKTSNKYEMKKPSAPVKKVPKSQPLSLLDMISDAPQASANFQIHDDGDRAAKATPGVKKSSRDRLKIFEDTPKRAPTTRSKAQDHGSISKAPERNDKSPTILPITKIDLTESSSDIVIESPTKEKPEIGSRRPKYTATRNLRKADKQSEENSQPKKLKELTQK